jgi:hypothetical protein
MIGEQLSDATAQRSCPVAVDYAHFPLPVQESFIKELVYQIDGFVRGLADEIDF